MNTVSLEKILTTPRIIRRFLLATACAWGLTSISVKAAMGDEPLPVLISRLQYMSPDQFDELFRTFNEELAQASEPVREQKRQWLKQQWAALSPEQRDQLRSQVREHWRGMTPEQRQHLREVRQSTNSANAAEEQQEVRPQRLSPDERQEFRQWMHERRGPGGGGDRGGYSLP